MVRAQQPEPVDPAVENAAKYLVDVVTAALEGQQGGAVEAFEKILMEYGAKARVPATPSAEESWRSLVADPVAGIDATYRLLRSGLGRNDAPDVTLAVRSTRDGFEVAAPLGLATGIAYFRTGSDQATVEQWPQGERTHFIKSPMPENLPGIVTFDSRRITGVGAGVHPTTDTGEQPVKQSTARAAQPRKPRPGAALDD